MPIVVAVAIRYIIMAAVQLGLWSLLEKGIDLLNEGIKAIMIKFGVDEDTAQDIMANKVLFAFEEVGVFAASLRTKLPIKVAEKLGFTSKGYAKRIITKEAAVLAEKEIINSTSKTVATTAEIEKVSEVIAKKSGWKISGVGDLLKYVTLIVGTPVGFFYAFAQYVDYAAWQNPYQKTFEGLLGAIGIKPDTALPSSKVISAETWKRIYYTIEQLKPLGVTFPFSGNDVPYTRENLARLVDEVAANMVKASQDPTYKKIMAVLLLQLQFGGKEPKVPDFGTIKNDSNTSSSNTSSSNTSSSNGGSGVTTLSAYYASKNQTLPSIAQRAQIYQRLGLGQSAYYTGTAEQNTKLLNALMGKGINNGLTLTPNGNNGSNQFPQVVTGVLSQGSVGNTVDFISRQDDLIENADELKQAMHNNLAPFLATIPGRVTYEVKIVSSITTSTGFQQKGSVQKVLTGYTTKGVAKYKNVVNKFAVLDMKIKTATGSLAKLGTIILGPVDSVKFSAQNIDLSGVANTVQQNIIAPVNTTQETQKVSNIMQDGETKNTTIQDIVKMGYTIDQAYRLIGGPNHNNGANYVTYYGSVAAAANAFSFKPDLNRQPEPMTIEYIVSLGYTAQEANYIVTGGSAYLDPTNPLYTGAEPN